MKEINTISVNISYVTRTLKTNTALTKLPSLLICSCFVSINLISCDTVILITSAVVIKAEKRLQTNINENVYL